MALLKDQSLEAMPTDLVGHIYFEVDLEDPSSVEDALEDWIIKSLNISRT